MHTHKTHTPTLDQTIEPTISAINMYTSRTPGTLLCRISSYTKHRVFVWCRMQSSLKPLQMWAYRPCTQLCLFTLTMWKALALTEGMEKINFALWCSQEELRSVVGDVISVILAFCEKASSVQFLLVYSVRWYNQTVLLPHSSILYLLYTQLYSLCNII